MIWSFGFIFFMTAASLVATALATIFTLTSSVCVISLVAGLGLTLIAVKGSRLGEIKILKPKISDWILISCFLLFVYRQFVWLAFIKGDMFMSLNPNNFGDLPLHITIIQYFVRSGVVWPANPIFTGSHLHYSYGMDFFTSMFVKLGFPVESALVVTGLVTALVAMYFLYQWAGGFALGALLFSGGVAGFNAFQSHILDDYQRDLAWKNLALTLFIPQRAILAAIPMGLFLLWAWHRRFFKSEPVVKPWVEGVIWGALPLFHLHTFIFISLYFSALILVSRKFRQAFEILAPAIPLGTYFVLKLTGGLEKASAIHIKAGWMKEDKNLIDFLWTNYGLWIPITFWALYLSLKMKSREFVVPMLFSVLFHLILYFVMFAPWEWDNTKLMIWCYLLSLPIIKGLILDRLVSPVRGALLICLFFSGFICVASTYFSEPVSFGFAETKKGNTGYSIYSVSEVEGVCLALKSLAPNDRVATQQTFNHPVALCGQPLVAGYSGHLWSHGINAKDVEDKLSRLMMGDENYIELAKQLDAKYIFWGTRESQSFAMSKKPWKAQSQLVANGVWGELWKVAE